MGTNYIKSNIEEDIEKRNQFKIKNSRCPHKKSDAVSKSFVDRGLNDPSIIRNTSHVDFNENNLDNFRFVNANSMPEVGEHLTA